MREKTILDITNGSYTCEYCKDKYYTDDNGNRFPYVCSKTPLHVSYIFITETETGKTAKIYSGRAKAQELFLDGFYAAQDKKSRSNDHYYKGLTFNAGYDFFKILYPQQ